jgi:hypothetical protein
MIFFSDHFLFYNYNIFKCLLTFIFICGSQLQHCFIVISHQENNLKLVSKVSQSGQLAFSTGLIFLQHRSYKCNAFLVYWNYLQENTKKLSTFNDCFAFRMSFHKVISSVDVKYVNVTRK